MNVPRQAKDLRVDIHTDTDPGVGDCGSMYLQCERCLDEWNESFQGVCTPKNYARQQCAWTGDGFQVWCTRHEQNVALFTFRAVRTEKEERRSKR